ncbi:hypothetical protein GM3708_3589 (plasmid) [Geminocystis sp. NIES-3708]|uniref:hypothetical protein n=1 Tax=Geminocystis sp. NIES-3708 TaxID=1615909 RepID=UPI0005FCD44B|nr:hypothetical protein [Geminocystis sp. NIES-3708]BAQ63183.1 hypothetical protein GM3708_3589 [Geminocystis sp. NIES-3708]
MFSSLELGKLKEYVDFYLNNSPSPYVGTDSDLTKYGFIFIKSSYLHYFHFNHLAYKIIVTGNNCQWSLTLVRNGKHYDYTEENRNILETSSVLTPEFDLLIEEIQKKYPVQFIFDDLRKVIELKEKLLELHNVIIPF